jgi:hypothetical protein
MVFGGGTLPTSIAEGNDSTGRKCSPVEDRVGCTPWSFVGDYGGLQFCRLVLEMLSEEAAGASRPVGPIAKRQPSPGGLGHRFPNIVERRRRGTLSPQGAPVLCRKHFQDGPAEESGRGGRIRTWFGGADAHTHSIQLASAFLRFGGLRITLHQRPQFANTRILLANFNQR